MIDVIGLPVSKDVRAFLAVGPFTRRCRCRADRSAELSRVAGLALQFGSGRSSISSNSWIDRSSLVDDVMRTWPGTIRTLLDNRMNCAGCLIACFHTVADACHAHHVAIDKVLGELRAIAAQLAQGVSCCFPRPA